MIRIQSYQWISTKLLNLEWPISESCKSFSRGFCDAFEIILQVVFFMIWQNYKLIIKLQKRLIKVIQDGFNLLRIWKLDLNGYKIRRACEKMTFETKNATDFGDVLDCATLWFILSHGSGNRQQFLTGLRL